MAGFAGVDFIDFDSQLNDEEKLVRQTARQFVDNEIIPIIEKHSREGTFPNIWFRNSANSDFSAPICRATAARECPTSLMVW